MAQRLGRRAFLRQSATLAAASPWLGAGLFGAPAALRPGSANERLNIGIIGTANRAESNIDGVRGENIVALCDVDEGYLKRAGEQFPKAARFADFRKLLDAGGLDAVVISTPDHIHAPAAGAALTGPPRLL